MKIYAEFPITDRQERTSLIWPDSCWLLSDRPLYIPDFAPAFLALPAIACKVGRLGKCVAPRFASRYAGDWTAALIILPATTVEGIGNGRQPGCAEWCFDNSLVIGEWQSEPPASLSIITASADSESSSVAYTAETGQARQCVMESLCNLSRHNTLKMGDIILSPLPDCSPVNLYEGLHLSVFAFGEANDPQLCRNQSDDAAAPILTTRFK